MTSAEEELAARLAALEAHCTSLAARMEAIQHNLHELNAAVWGRALAERRHRSALHEPTPQIGPARSDRPHPTPRREADRTTQPGPA